MQPLRLAPLAFALACSTSEPELVGTLETVHLVPGKGWDVRRTLEDIASTDLVAHNEAIEARFQAGALLANALRSDGGGFYLYDAAVVDRTELIETDPAYATQLLVPAAQTRWSLRFEDLGATVSDDQGVYLVDVTGPVEDAHLEYWNGLSEAGNLLAAGTFGENHQLYAVVAESRSEVDQLVAADPTGPSVTVVAWGNPKPFPVFFHRRSLTATREVQP